MGYIGYWDKDTGDKGLIQEDNGIYRILGQGYRGYRFNTGG